MPTVVLACPSCRVPLKLADPIPGRKVRCSRCGNIFLPGTEPATLSEEQALADMVSLWEERRAAGRQAAPAELCRDRPALRAELERRIAALQHMDRLAASPPAGAAQASEQHTSPSHPEATVGVERRSVGSSDIGLRPPKTPDELGRLGVYQVLKVLGEGGMGRVYLAEDTLLQRQIALKVLLPNYAGDPKARLRFFREARAAAALEHDNIVTIHQVGEDNGVPFLAMPLLKGESLEDRLRREKRLPIAEALRIGREVAEGLAAAHAQGLIHRDIKPGNLWLEGGRRRVKILDFGLARAADGGPDNPLTAAGAVLGTPAYMAPEQARGETLDARCDLFSLGCVLHRTITGEPPFRGSNMMAILSALATHTPPPLAVLHPDVPPDLSNLVVRLLAKQREGRPASAQAAAEELRAMQSRAEKTLPVATVVVAGASVAEPSRPPVKRRRIRLKAVGAGILATILLFGVVFTLRTKNGTLVVKVTEPDVQVFVDGEEKITIDSKKVGRVELVPGKHHLMVRRGAEELHTASFTLKSGGEVVIDAEWQPKRAARRRPGPAEGVLPGLIARPAVLPGIKRWQAETSGPPNRIYSVAWSPDGKYLAYSRYDNLVRIYDAATLHLVRVLVGHEGRIWPLVWSPDGKWLASGGHDRTVRLWDAEGRAGLVLRGHTGVVCSLAWSPDSKHLASGGSHGDGSMRLWSEEGKAGPVLKHESAVRAIAWSPDGKTLASADLEARKIRLWNPMDGTSITTLGPLPTYVLALSWSPDGKFLASDGGDWEKEKIGGWIWDVRAQKRVVALSGLGSWITWFGWNSQSKLAATTQDGFVVINDPQSGKIIVNSPYGSPALVGGACWSPDGRQIADSNGQIWIVSETGRELTFARGRLHTRMTGVYSVAWNPDGRRLASGGEDLLVRLWDSTGKPGAVLKGHEAYVSSVAWSPDGTRLASAGGGVPSTVRLWNAEGTPGAIREGHEGLVWSVSWSPDGKQFASASEDKTVRLWNADGKAGAVLKGHEAGVLSVAWSPDGTRLASGDFNHTIRLWSPDGTPGLVFKGHENVVRSVAWSPDSKRLASANGDQTVRLWDADGTPGPVLKGHEGLVHSVVWSPDGKRLASGGSDDTVRLWEADGIVGPILKGHVHSVRSVAWSRDGKWLASGSMDGTIRIWSDRGDPERTMVVLPDGKAATFSAAGELLYGEPEVIEKEIVYLVERDDGRIDVQKPSAFRQTVQAAIKAGQR